MVALAKSMFFSFGFWFRNQLGDVNEIELLGLTEMYSSDTGVFSVAMAAARSLIVPCDARPVRIPFCVGHQVVKDPFNVYCVSLRG